MDSLSLILDDMHINGVIFVSTTNTSPWSWALATPGLACFHIVTRGQAWLVRAGHEPVWLQTGDLIMLSDGARHCIQDKALSAAMPQDLLPWLARSEIGMAALLSDSTSSKANPGVCQLISGHARFDVDMAAPLVAALPPLIHLQSSSDTPPLWLSIGVQFLAQELAAPRPAQQAIINRLGDIMFFECLRHHVESVPEGSANWLAGLKDRALSAALACMHRDPRHTWTVPELARQACLSRSAFADRFSQLMGEPPLTYLTRHRMRLAAHQLEHTKLAVGTIADAVGYASEGAFSQAFKRTHGVSPSQWRQRKAVGHADLPKG